MVAQKFKVSFFYKLPDGSPFQVVIASRWHHQKALEAVLFDGETSAVFKMNQVPDCLGCNCSSVLSRKASPVSLGRCFLNSCKDSTVSSSVLDVWSWW